MTYRIRPARADDVRAIAALRLPMEGEVLLHHDLVALFERVQEFVVAVDENDTVVGAGGLHVMWEDLAEIRSLIVDSSVRGKGIGRIALALLLEMRHICPGCTVRLCSTCPVASRTSILPFASGVKCMPPYSSP